jgi:hypothetical protein
VSGGFKVRKELYALMNEFILGAEDDMGTSMLKEDDWDWKWEIVRVTADVQPILSSIS